MLHKYAQETVRQRERTEPDLHAAYLVGSLLDAEPMLGGSTDIDVVLVHKYQALVERETQAITPEVS
jgi:predicted nucleotidyltransferase